MRRREGGGFVSLAAGLGAAMAAGLLSVGVIVRPAHLAGAPPSEDDERPLPPARHEERDVLLLPLLLGGGGVLLAVVGAMGLAAWLYPAGLRGKLVTTPVQHFPAPQLQTRPPEDMVTMRAGQLRELGEVFWIDRPRGIVHMSIDDAMRAVARAGIADWPTTTRVQR